MIGFIQRLLFKQLVATDVFGNKYYQYGKKRWVEYSGINEPTKVSPDYYLWLHHGVDKLEIVDKHIWEKERVINLTGTIGAYLPNDHILKNPFVREKKDYIPWKPEDE